MSSLIINYRFDTNNLANPNGTLPTTAVDCTPTAGPGATVLGDYPGALRFGPVGKASVVLPVAQTDPARFTVRVLFRIDAQVMARQNLVESTGLPFSLFLDRATSPGNACNAVVSVAPAAHGWCSASTDLVKSLEVGTWYLLDLVYSTDTLAVAIDGTVLSVHAFPNGNLTLPAGGELLIGVWADSVKHHFLGSMAALQVHSGIPIELESQLDERRASPEWFITYKYEAIRPTVNLGLPQGRHTYAPGVDAYVQRYQHGQVMFNPAIGAAFEMHGAIFEYYTNQADRQALGCLVSDEGAAGQAGSRKSLFRKGGIYWSAYTGAVPVTGQIYLDYEAMGEARSVLSLPTAPAAAVNGGQEQIFQAGRMYHKTGAPQAHEVHGTILTRFLAEGGINAWGYPSSNECDVKRGSQVIGKLSDFERCTIYWSGATGAWEVHGDIRERYRGLGGPLSSLGFPTSDETNIPGAPAPARYNTFQNGSILWFGNGNLFVCYPFKVYIGRISTQESEGAFMGQNDLYLRINLKDNGHEIYRNRFPNSGDYGGSNIKDLNRTLTPTIVPNSPNRRIELTLDIWESDDGAPFGAGDDHLGTYRYTLNMANAWGMRNNQGVFNTGRFDQVNSVTWSVKPQVNESVLTETQKWWGVQNRGTPTLTYQQYASAFRDVDSEAEWWDLTDWLEKAFYELVIKGLADDGNCFGMSLEAIYARKHRSIFGLPLDRFTDWATVVNEFNIKHQYQMGADPIWWFVGEFLSGNTHDPVDVFRETRNAMGRGDNPVLCISQNYDFSGAPHCILPVAWDSSAKPWRLRVLDPNSPATPGGSVVREVLVDPDKNEFTYAGSKTYKGGEWSGGRMHYMPYSVLNERPRTPIWDAVLLLLAGLIIIVGSDAETEILTDGNGVDLDAFGTDAVARRRAGQPVDDKVVAFKGFDAIGKGLLASELLIRAPRENHFLPISLATMDARALGSMNLATLSGVRRLAQPLKPLAQDRDLFAAIQDRDLRFVLADPATMQRIDPGTAQRLQDMVQAARAASGLRHRIKAVRNGTTQYAVKSGFSQFRLSAPCTKGEVSQVNCDGLGSAEALVEYRPAADRLARVEITNRLGAGKDQIKLVIDGMRAVAARGLAVNVRPGLAGVDVVGAGAGVPLNVTVETVIDGQTRSSRYEATAEGEGMRIRPSTALTRNELTVGQVDRAFGQLLDSRLIRASA